MPLAAGAPAIVMCLMPWLSCRHPVQPKFCIRKHSNDGATTGNRNTHSNDCAMLAMKAPTAASARFATPAIVMPWLSCMY